ncbi:MAG: UDP-2,3-diacylglucosamine diphosphatase LpxI [Silicimonas sp.]
MLALVAGKGRLPGILVEALSERPHVASLEGADPDGLVPDQRFRIEQLGTFLESLTARGVTEVCFAGAISRPALDPSKVDAATMPLVPRMMAALHAGDDGALRAVIAIFEEGGFRIAAADDLLPSLLPKPGFASARRAQENHVADAERAAAVIAGLGSLDIGQSCAVKAGQVLAVEGIFGTDWMLESLKNRPDGAGGVFFKARKPDQDRRIDLPTIGVGTVTGVAKAGLEGIVVEAGGVMVLDQDAVERAADEAGIFLWVRE